MLFNASYFIFKMCVYQHVYKRRRHNSPKKKDKQRSTKHKHKTKTKGSHIMHCVNCVNICYK